MATPTETPSFEDALRELVSIVEKLEAGQLALNENIALYERGQKLTAYCNGLLDTAEVQVRTVGESPAPNSGDLTLF